MRRAPFWPAAGALVFLSALAAFLPALSGSFLNWDDAAYLVDNARFLDPGPGRLWWLLTNRLMGVYQPLSWLSYALDYLIWGLDPRGFHLTNLLLHAATAVLFLRLAYALLLASAPHWDEATRRLGAVLAALFFALHPLRVESVAWISERRDVLSGFFYVLALLAYLKNEPAGCFAAFLLSLLAKGMGVTFPFVLLLLDRYPLKRKPALREKLPFFAAAAVFALVGAAGQFGSGATMELSNYGPLMRLAQAAYGAAFYLAKTLFPAGLSPLYLHPSQEPFAPVYLRSAVLVLLISSAAWALRRRLPAFSTLWAHYLLTLLPVLGLIPFGPQVAADRYTYLACMGWAVAAGALLARLARGRPRAPALRAAAALLMILGALSWRQSGFWRDSIALWNRALSVDPRNVIARSNLAGALASAGRAEEAVAHYRLALEAGATAERHNNLGAALAQSGKIAEALPHFQEALRLDPGSEKARGNLERARKVSASRRPGGR